MELGLEELSASRTKEALPPLAFSVTESKAAWGDSCSQSPVPRLRLTSASSPLAGIQAEIYHALLALLSRAKPCESAENRSPDSRVTEPQSSGSFHRCQLTLWPLLLGRQPRLAVPCSCVYRKSPLPSLPSVCLSDTLPSATEHRNEGVLNVYVSPTRAGINAHQQNGCGQQWEEAVPAGGGCVVSALG